jgi:menaquinone-dependent protoporphyrinogen oxidase
VVCRPVGPELDPAAFDAVVLGSAVHNMAWLAPAVDFLGRLPATDGPDLWCFSVGGLPHPDRSGVRRWMARNELQKIARGFPAGRRPRDHRLFAGVVHVPGAPLWARLFFRAVGVRTPDQREWPAVDAWAARIAGRLLPLGAPAGPPRP